MKTLILTVLLSFFNILNAQEVQTVKKSNTYPTQQAAIGKGTLTTYWKVINNNKIPVYRGPKNGLYYVVKKDSVYKRMPVPKQ
jgi:hypothetical protein